MSNRNLKINKTVVSDLAPEEEKEEKKKKRKDLAGGVGRSIVPYIPVVGQFLGAGNSLYQGVTGEPGPFGSGAGIAEGNIGKILFDPDDVLGAFGVDIFKEGGQIKKKTETETKTKKRKNKRVVRGVGAAKRGYGKATYSKRMY